MKKETKHGRSLTAWRLLAGQAAVGCLLLAAPESGAYVATEEAHGNSSPAAEASMALQKEAVSGSPVKKKKQTKAKTKSKTKAKAKAKNKTKPKVAKAATVKKVSRHPDATDKSASVTKVKQPVKNVAYSAPASGQWPVPAFDPADYPVERNGRGVPIKFAALGGLPASREVLSENQAKPVEPVNRAEPEPGSNRRYDLTQRPQESSGRPAMTFGSDGRDAIRQGRPDPAPGMTFEALARLALASHPSITAKQALLEAAKADLVGANWQRFPTPSIEAGAASSQGGFGTFSVQQPIWTGGRITAGIEGADAQRKAAEVSVEEAKRELFQRLVSAFAEAQRQQMRQEAARNGVREHEKLLNLIERRVKQQVSPQVDQTFAKARLLQASNELSVATQALSNALNQLSQLSGQQVVRVAPMSTAIADLPEGMAAAQGQAARNSPVLARLGFEEEAAGADISAKKSGYMPQVSVRYERATGTAINNLGNEGRVMFVLEAQPGAGLSAGAGVDSAIAKRDAIRRGRDVALLEIHERVATDWNDLMVSRQRLENTLQGRSVANEVFDSYTRQFTAGKKTWIDVMNAVREATQAELAVADAEGQVIAAALRLKLETGTLDVGSAN